MSPADEPARLPDFLVVGAMRSGTTSLYRYLGAHPDVFMVPKELQFFTEHYAKGMEWYRKQFAPGSGIAAWGEATADYLARESAMRRIAKTLPNVRLVALLRNPVDRTWSHYGLLRARGRETRSFGDAMEHELGAIASGGPGADGVFYLAHSLYDVHLERAFRLFDAGQVHVSIFERMATDAATGFAAVCRFLGVDGAFKPPNLGEPVNAYVTFRSLRLRNLSQRLPSPLRRAVARVNTRRNVAQPSLDPRWRARLEEFFTPRIAEVESILGAQIPEWRP